MSWLVSLLVLSALIFFHELGHYAMARFFGVYIEIFSIGFGKKIASFRMFNTEWRIAMIPLGGYVKMKGQDDSDPTVKSYDKDSYNSKTPLQRILILFAGPAANFVLAFFLYIFIGLGSPAILSPVIGKISPNSPAFIAGLESNDTITAIDGKSITTWEEMSDIISHNKGESLDLKVKRADKILHISLTPKITKTKSMFNEDIYKPMIGVGSAGVTHKLDLTPGEVIKYAADQTAFASTMIFKSVEKLIMGDVPAKEMGGVISIMKITSDATAQGWMAVLFFAALISVNLGVLNILPIPALDGGHIMFNLYEMVTRRAPSEAMLVRLTIAGWVILFSLMGLGLYNDINRLIG
ncbi:RIP metalloprotease RseP [Sulfurimonas sp. HSL-1716]|uniref:RIP metalloprotease RseP n=1 Tax=Hydrocurvibacter sulfurireducens TaxID=3131937 RepID=UPI0031F76137